MTQYTQTAEGGVAGSAVTVGNSGGTSGTAFSLVSIGGAATATYSATGKGHGSLGYRIQSPGASTDKVYLKTTLATPVDFFSDRTYFTLNTVPTTAQDMVVFYDTGGTALKLFSFGMLSGGVLRVSNAAGATLSQFAGPLTAGTLYRVESQWHKGTGTTDGQVAVQLYAGDSNTALWTYSATNINAGTTQFLVKWLGDGGANHATDITFDDILLDDSTQTAVGPWTAAPTSAVTPTSVVSGTGWTAAGAVDIPTALSDASDSSYALSPDSPASSTLIVQTNGALTGGAITVTPRMSKRDTSTVATVKVTLLNSTGTAVAAEQTYTLTTAPTDYPYNLTSAENNALTVRSGLQWRIIATA
jgi:hypothetical protein